MRRGRGGRVGRAGRVTPRHVAASPGLRTVAVGAWLVAPAVDARAGHAFVTTFDDVTSHTTGTVSMPDAATL